MRNGDSLMDVSRWRSARGFLVELGIVVLGILIALGLDRVNERRKDRAAESAYVSALADDLAADTATLTRVIEGARGHRDAARRVWERIEGASESSQPGNLAWDLNYAGWINFFAPNDFTYRDLISTGRLGLIRDANLKRDILAYYGRIEYFAQFYDVWSKAPLERYNPELERILSLSEWQVIASSRANTEADSLDADGVLRALRGSRIAQNALVTIAESAEQQIETWQELRAQATELLSRVDAAMGVQVSSPGPP